MNKEKKGVLLRLFKSINKKDKYRCARLIISCIVAITIMLFLWVNPLFYFPLLIILITLLIVDYSNLALQKFEPLITGEKDKDEAFLNNAELKTNRIKFIIQYIVFPIFSSFVAYLITDRIYGDKEVIIVGVGNSSYSDTLELAKMYKEKYINKANEMLGAYNPGLQFDIVTVSGSYDEIWNALKTKRIDIALITSYNFYNSIIDSSHKIDSSLFTFMGGKYTETGDTYNAGFLVPRKFLDSSERKPKINWKDTIELFLSKDTLSGSGFRVPIYYLQNQITIRNADSSNIAAILKGAKTNTLPENVTSVYKGPSSKGKYRICSFSSDMWNNLKRFSPFIANSLYFVPIENSINDTFSLPLDAVVVNKENWKKFTSPWSRFVDFIKLRNIDFRETRSTIIFKALRYVVDCSINDSARYLKLCKYRKYRL